MGNGSLSFQAGKSSIEAICPTFKVGQIFLLGFRLWSPKSPDFGAKSGDFALQPKFHLFYFQDLEFHLATGCIGFHDIADLAIHHGAAYWRLV